MKIVIASDHGGFDLKNDIAEFLKFKNIDFEDIGTFNANSCDYPFYAKRVCEEIKSEKFDRGILVCGTGIGMAICANRYRGIRAANVSDTFSARMSRAHNDSNVLTLGQRVVGKGLALDIVDIWLKTPFDGERHKRRVDMIDN